MHRLVDTDAVNRFVVLASAIGLNSADIGRMMKQKNRFAENRLSALWREGRMEVIARAAGVQCDPKWRVIYADWRQHRKRFPGVARQLKQCVSADSLTYREILLLWGVVRVAAQWKARSVVQKRVARTVLHLGRVGLETSARLRRVYRVTMKW